MRRLQNGDNRVREIPIVRNGMCESILKIQKNTQEILDIYIAR